MAPVAVDLERRQECRREGGGVRWRTQAVLRPGQPITLINISSRAALIESACRLRPGAQTEVQLVGTGTRACVKGRLERCVVTAIDPMRYRGVVFFDQCIDLGGEAGESRPE